MPGVPRLKSVPGPVPDHGVRRVLDAEMIGEPHRKEVGLDGKLETQAAPDSGLVPEDVLHHAARVAIGAELKALDLYAVQHRPIAKPIAIGIVDEFGGRLELDLLVGSLFADPSPEAIHQFDG